MLSDDDAMFVFIILIDLYGHSSVHSVDLFSSIAAASQNKGFKNSDLSIRSGDEELDQAFSRQNSAFNTPSPNAAPKNPPININALIDQTQMPLTSSKPNSKVHHKRSSSGGAVAPFTQRHADQPLKNSNCSKEAAPRVKKPAADNFSEMATGDNSTARNAESPQTQVKSGQDTKLYDEISHSSDPKIGKWIGVPDGTTSTEQDPSFLMRSIGGGFEKGLHPYEMDEHRGRFSKCRPCTKFFIVGLLLVIAGMGIGGYFWFFHGAEEVVNPDNNSGVELEKVDEGPFEADVNANSDQTNKTVITPPPSDIEARCSASNLPGSLSACLSACLPSACCYPDFTGETCFDNDGCPAYKPHCDAFYDAWMGSTEGVLRTVTDEMINMCTGTENLVINEPSSPISAEGVKRLRGHAHNSRNLQAASYKETCEQYCIAAKCCSAPTITNLELSGLILSPTGVYTNATSGDFVMTNCQASNSKNTPLCTQYASFCLTDEVIDQGSSNTTLPLSPTQVPGSSANVSVPDIVSPAVSPSSPPVYTGNQVSISPSSSTINASNPTDEDLNYTNNQTINFGNSSVLATATTTSPSYTQNPNMTTNSSTSEEVIVLPANSQAIQDSCTSTEAAVLIEMGDAEARSRCAKACQFGLCCFPEQLGYAWMESCYQNNTQICTEYSPCLILEKEVPVSNSSGEIVWVDNATITVEEEVFNETTPENSAAIVTIDSDLANSTAAEENSTISIQQEPAQDGNATMMINETDIFQIAGPPAPEQDLALQCSEDSISQITGLTQCLTACSLGSCCTATDETECMSTHAEICYLYTPCNNAYSLLYPS